MLSRIVNVHHENFAGFSKGDIDYRDPNEVVMVFDTSPSFGDVVEKVRSELNWRDKNDVVDLQGRYNVSHGHYVRWKMMPVDSESRWEAYKAVVLDSQDKSFELFATKKVGARVHIDLNLEACASQGSSPVQHEEARVDPGPEVYDTLLSQPPLTQPLSPVMNNDYRYNSDDDYADGDAREGGNGGGDASGGNVQSERQEAEGDPTEHCFRNHDVGDVEANCLEEEMDHNIPYSRAFTMDSDDEGPEEEIDEDGLTAKEARAFLKAVGRDHRASLFSDLSLAGKAVVDGGTSKVLGPRTYSKKETELNKHGVGKATIFTSFAHLKAWLSDFSLKHHRPFRVKYSDEKKRYTVICEQGPKKCPWIVRAVPMKGMGTQWKLTDCCFNHRCDPKELGKANAIIVALHMLKNCVKYSTSPLPFVPEPLDDAPKTFFLAFVRFV